MSLALFQVLCFPVLAGGYALLFRGTEDRRELALTITLFAVGAWLGEHTCIAWYGYYAYSHDWWAFVGNVPLLVPLIWPMVVLSAEQVVRALHPEASQRTRLLAIALAVVFDASLMEVVAVKAGYWTWAEGGHLEVPLVGMIGWGFFAASAMWWRSLVTASTRLKHWIFALPLVAGALTHGLILASWWLVFRWALRGDLGDAAIWGFGALSIALSIWVLKARPRRLPWDTMLARVVASTLFFALLVAVSLDGVPWRHWIHLGFVAVPYLLASPSLRSLPQRVNAH